MSFQNMEDVMDELESFRKNMDLLKKPSGEKQKPGQTCADLGKYDSYPGEYWIDPNQGYWSDALKVTCYFDKSTRQIKSCLKVSYQNGQTLEKLLTSQLNFLQLSSVTIRQHFTISCRDLQIHVDNQIKNNIQFFELNEQKIMSYQNATNNCQIKTSVSSGFWYKGIPWGPPEDYYKNAI